MVIWKLQIAMEKKLQIWALMSLGVIATGFGVARASSLGLKTSDLSCKFLLVPTISYSSLARPCYIFQVTMLFAGYPTSRVYSDPNIIKTGTYCVAALWSNLELYLGIAAANLSLSRFIYSYFKHGKADTNHSSAQNSGYINSTHTKGDYFGNASAGNTTHISTNNHKRPPTTSQSDDSDIPLEPCIQKTVEVWQTEEDAMSTGKGRVQVTIKSA
jgi:hypothetical protein